MLFKSYRLLRADPRDNQRLWLAYDDGFEGEFDMTRTIARGGVFAALADPAYFASVAIGNGGRSFGWNLDAEGDEVDFCADAARFELETQVVERLAAEYRAAKTAAE